MEEELRLLLQKENTQENWISTANWIIQNKQVSQIISLFLYDQDKRIVQKASAVFMTLCNIDKQLFYPFQEELVDHLSNPSTTTKRNILRLFQEVYIKEEVEGKLLDYCFKYLEDFTQPIAIRAFSMTVAYRLGERYPEILPELKSLIEANIEIANSAGIENRGIKIMKKIDQFKA